MKSIKEKQMLVKWAKALNEEIDSTILKDVEEYERLQSELKESLKENPLSVEGASITETQPLTENIVKEEKLVELKEQIIEKTDLITKSVEEITKRVVREDSYQQPNPPLVDKNLEAVQKKLKFLEQAIGKMAAHGAGGGDANPFDRVEWMERGVRFTPTPRMAYWNNTEDCLNITHADGSTLQVGLENYIRVFNNTANTLSNGTFVEFTGIDAEGDAPTFRAYVNDANAQPLYNIGVLTTDVASNTHGRATVLGLVRDIDTTGNAVGEVWAPGDLLWASPSYPGNYTKFKPTAPNVALSVAAVTTVSPTNGIILVRPTVWPRLQYGDFYRQNGYSPGAPNIDLQVPFSNTIITSGFTRTANVFTALNSGLYKFDFRAQLTSTNSSDKSAVFWFKKNGVNLPFSAVRVSVATNGGYATVTNTQVVSLIPTDNITIHFTVTDTALKIDSPAVVNGSANVPAAQLTIIEAAL